MVEKEKVNLRSISDKIDELSREKKGTEKHSESQKENVVLFFSYDIVNSTAYKMVNYYGWAQVLNLLFKELREEIQREIDGAEMWRVLGDEAIFIIEVRSEELLRRYINKIFKVMVETIYKIKSGAFFKFDDELNRMKLQNIISLKAAAWIAAVTDVGDINYSKNIPGNAANIFEHYKSKEGNQIFEFLGNDIDTGFRIAEQTRDGCMVLSYELAYLISRKDTDYLHIITYRRLKGVWREKLYPIVWYHDPEAYSEFLEKKIELEESFPFDACDESDLIKEYYDHRGPNEIDRVIRDKQMYTDSKYALDKILQDRELSEKVEHLQELIRGAIHDPKTYINTELMEVHCVAVCFQECECGTRILVAKRLDTRKKHKGEWEFGCAKAVIDKSIAQKIKEEYKQDFDLDVEPVLDEMRELKEPVPIALYQSVHRPQENDTAKKDKGIITLARIMNHFQPEDFRPSSKHEKLQWVTEEDLPNIKTRFEKTVPDFEQTLRGAFAKIKELSEGKKRDDTGK